MLLGESLRGRCICVVDSLTLVLLLVKGNPELHMVKLTLSHLCLHVDLVFAELTPTQSVIPNQLLLHGAVFHDRLTVVAILGNLLLECGDLLLLLALELLLVGALPQLRQLVLHLEHLNTVGLKEVFFVSLQHVVKLCVQVSDLVINLPRQESYLFVIFELIQGLHDIGGVLVSPFAQALSTVSFCN